MEAGSKKSIVKGSFFSVVIALVCIVCAAFVFYGCAQSVTVEVIDGSTKSEVETQTGVTVEDVLNDAGIKVGEGDETDPVLDEKITSETKTITVKRYAKVTIINGSETEVVELVGATVADALEQAGITLGEGDETDIALSEYLENGMTITVLKPKNVAIVLDGVSENITTKAETVKDLLAERSITLGEGDTIDVDMDEPLAEGVVITIETAQYIADKNAQAQAEAAALAKQQTTSSSNSSNSNSSNSGSEGSSGPTIVSKTKVPNCDDESHGYYEITYSDGSVSYQEY